MRIKTITVGGKTYRSDEKPCPDGTTTYGCLRALSLLLKAFKGL